MWYYENINNKKQAVSISLLENEEYISLTDIVRYKNTENPKGVVQNWMRNRNTIEFLGIWELIHNPNFKGIEFEVFKKDAGLNSFTLEPQKWIEVTNENRKSVAIGFNPNVTLF